jgi:hypothetical protein
LQRSNRGSAWLKLPDLARHTIRMIETLADLQRLRLHLRDAVTKLMAQAEGAAGCFAATAFAKLASDCQRLDREIELLSKDALTAEPPSGAA